MLHSKQGKIEIDKHNLPDIPSLKELVDTFKSDDSTKLLIYIYLVYDRDEANPIREFKESDRILMARKVAFGDENTTLKELYPNDTKLISSVIKDFIKYKEDKIQKDIDLYDKKIYQFIDLLKSIKPEIVKNTHSITDRVTFSTNIDIITTILDNSINIILDKSALVSMKKTGKYSNELRGGLSPHIKGKTKINNKSN